VAPVRSAQRKLRKYVGYYARLAHRARLSIAKGVTLPFARREAFDSGVHEMAYPISTYAPWQAEDEFLRVYHAIRGHTMVDVWRCHELWSLLGELGDVPGAILEVGVWSGGTGALMAAQATELGLPDHVYLCDTWSGVVKTGLVDTYYRDGMHDDTSRETVEQLVRRMGLRNVELLQGVFPDETGDLIADRIFRLCHCDVDVYQSAKDVFDWVWPRLSPGGVVVFDDYGFTECPGVTQLVDEQRMREDRMVLHNLNGHGLVVKR
jgi:O-methyltransferase